ncbi:hypothetical protein [Burkholderia sp. BCC1644]|uniref:hypothetical protein n=1 Tax=Burkholderia sp. BCC1644 TaxID=2676293 RepID=UPI001591FEB9|nr:hypothetical protein [Burkholderia sp. BCC1644]
MKYLRDLAEKYEIEVAQLDRLLIATTATPCNIDVDVGFGRSDLRKSIFFPHYDIGADVYVYGFGAKEFSARLREIDRLPEMLRHLFSEYAFAVEWDGKNLTANINMYYYDPYKDGLQVEMFFSELRDVSRYLQSAASSVHFEPQNVQCKIGPRWVRRATNVAAFFLPFLLFFLVMIFVLIDLKKR